MTTHDMKSAQVVSKEKAGRWRYSLTAFCFGVRPAVHPVLMAGDFAQSVQPLLKKKSNDVQRNGFSFDKKPNTITNRSAPAKADNFLQAFEKPSQIYRYMTTQATSNAPIFLHRTLSYMKQRMSRTHHRRNGFKVGEMLDRILCEIDAEVMKNRRDLTLVFKSFEDPHFAPGTEPGMAVISASVISVHHQPSSTRQLFQVKRTDQEQEIRKVLMSMEKDVPVTNGAAAGSSVRMTISKDVFPKMSKCFVKCVLVITVKPKYTTCGQGRASLAQCSPDSKRRKKVDAAISYPQGPVFKSEIVIYNSRMECQLVSGKYQVVSKLESQQNKTIWIGNSSSPAAEVALSHINCEAKVYLEVLWNDRPQSESAMQVPKGFINSLVPEHRPSSTQVQNEEVNVVFQFLLPNECQETSAKQHDFKCPWCNLNCLTLKSFACHLKNVHPRLNFRVRYESKGCRTDVQVDVSPNDSFDGSYSGNQQDLTHSFIPGRKFFGPMRRTPFTVIHVSKKCHFNDATVDADEEDVEPLRPIVHGHDRLYYHTNTCIPIRPQDMDIDSEDENDPQWMRYKTQQMIDEFSDVNDGEKEVMKLWNLHIMKYGFTGDCQIPEACRIFLEDRGEVLREKNLRFNFILHLISLYDFGLIDAVQKANLMRKLNAIFSRSYSVVSNGHSVLGSQNNVPPQDKGCQVS